MADLESVKVFALSMCISLVIGSLLSMVVPNLEKNRVFKIILSAFILTGLISPILSIINNIDIFDNVETMEYQDYSYDQDTLQNIEKNASISLYPIIKNELSKLGVEGEFGLNLSIDQEKEGIKIENVNINIWDLHSIEKEKLQIQLTKNTGLPVKIVTNEGEEN